MMCRAFIPLLWGRPGRRQVMETVSSPATGAKREPRRFQARGLRRSTHRRCYDLSV
ncbi:hypothetical protein PG5_28420 [Pseudomonas sp. G5(2012)]|nr:hypothetical protein PG5_28420 [Pseudomonas sp. G5(2012)]